MEKIYAFGTAELTVPATQKIAIYTNGNNSAQVFQRMDFVNQPSSFDLIATLTDQESVLGAFSATQDTVIRIEANSDEVLFAVGAQPTAPVLPTTMALVGGDNGRGVYYNATVNAGAPIRQGVIGILLERALGQDVVWDGNPDCAIKIQVNNRAANTANNGAVRGIDISARNRGTNVSWANGGSINARNDSGCTAYQLIGIQTRIENYGTLETEAVGLDINMSIENDTGAPIKDALRIRNTDQSGMTACNSAIAISQTSTNSFTYLFDLDGLTAAAGSIVSVSGTSPATHAGRLKVKLPDGSNAWLALYSVSNE